MLLIYRCQRYLRYYITENQKFDVKKLPLKISEIFVILMYLTTLNILFEVASLRPSSLISS